MKILQITNSESLSGGVFQMLELSKGLVKRGHDVTIGCRPTSTVKKKAVELNIKHAEFLLKNDPDVGSMYALFKHMRREKYDVVHAHHPKAHMLAMVASFFARVPVFVASRRVSFSIKENKGLLNPLKYTFSRINMILPVADAIGDILVREGVKKHKVRTVYSGTDPVRFDPESVKGTLRAELGIKDDDIVITKIAHYSVWKGYPCFFKAAKVLLEQKPNVKFILAGSGTDGDDVKKQLADIGILESFYCLGRRTDVPEILKASDIAVNAACAGEGLSGALREALFMGVPVVAADIAGNREICIPEKTGILFPINDDAALTKALTTLVDDPDMRQKMALYGRELTKKDFTTDAMTDKTFAIYDELLKNNR